MAKQFDSNMERDLNEIAKGVRHLVAIMKDVRSDIDEGATDLRIMKAEQKEFQAKFLEMTMQRITDERNDKKKPK